MKSQLIRMVTSDNSELQGLLYDAHPGTVALHLHGIWGNFYENPFIDHFASFYPEHGLSFLTVNTRDHDGGAIYSQFSDCLQDIDSILSFAARKGYQEAILQGHSLGALKAAYYLLHVRPELHPIKVKGLVLLSPFDNIAFYSSNNSDLRVQQLTKVRAALQSDPRALVPEDVWGTWMLSANTYLELVEDGGKADIFPFRRRTLRETAITKLDIPVFAAVGGSDFAASPSPASEYAQLRELPNVTPVLIDGAPHNFAGCEPVLLSHLLEWLRPTTK